MSKGRVGEEREKSRNRLLIIENKCWLPEVKWVGGWFKWWGLRKAFVVMSTRWCMEVLNHYIVHWKLILHCMLTDWNKNKKLKSQNNYVVCSVVLCSINTFLFLFCNASAWLRLWFWRHGLQRQLSQINTLSAASLAEDPAHRHLPHLCRVLYVRDIGWCR